MSSTRLYCHIGKTMQALNCRFGKNNLRPIWRTAGGDAESTDLRSGQSGVKAGLSVCVVVLMIRHAAQVASLSGHRSRPSRPRTSPRISSGVALGHSHTITAAASRSGLSWFPVRGGACCPPRGPLQCLCSITARLYAAYADSRADDQDIKRRRA